MVEELIILKAKIEKAIKALTNFKAHGTDKITAKTIKGIGE